MKSRTMLQIMGGCAVVMLVSSAHAWYLKMDPPPDVDKAAHGHPGSATCWLATAANMLAGAGYGAGATVQMRADNIYNQLIAKYGIQDGGWVDTALTWWLQSPNNVWLNNPYTVVTVLGNKSPKYPWANADGAQFMGNELRRCQFLGVSISWPVAGSTVGTGGHAITGWGDEGGGDALPGNPAQLIVTDSDRDQGGNVQTYNYDAYNNPNPGGANEGNGWYTNYSANHPYVKHIVTLCPTDDPSDNKKTQKVVGSYKIGKSSPAPATDLHYKVWTDVPILSYRTTINWSTGNSPVIAEGPAPRTWFTADWNLSDHPVPSGTWVTITTELVVPSYNGVHYSQVFFTYLREPVSDTLQPEIGWQIVTPVVEDPEAPDISGGYVIGSFQLYGYSKTLGRQEFMAEYRLEHEYDYDQDPELHEFTLELAEGETRSYQVENLRFGHTYGILDDDALWEFDCWMTRESDPLLEPGAPVQVLVAWDGQLPYPPGDYYIKPDLNHDNEVDWDDHYLFASCFGGPGIGPVPLECIDADFDSDDDVDCDDWNVFASAWTEPGSPAFAPCDPGACCNVVEGTCTHTMSWLCDGKFKPGAFCAMCINPENFLEPCDDDADCSGIPGACQDQVCSYSLTPCDTDDDCDTGAGEECLVLSTVCLTQACRNDATGECQEVVGASETCAGELGPGWTSLGFATSCTPNCCEQPLPRSGYDNCNIAGQNVTVINLPPYPGEVVSVTLTGNNNAATFDDWNNDWCESAIFNPDGEMKDPGWWEAFAVDDCAYVRLELCCTDPVLAPAWDDLYTGCPCQRIVGNAGVDPPIGTGKGTSGEGRGLPFCEDENLWLTFGPLPAGTYYYPIYSAPDGTFASPPGGDYQVNIHATSCPWSKCCYLACNAQSANAGQLCKTDDDCTGSDPSRACAPTCELLDVLDCRERNGWWAPDIVSCEPGVCDTGVCCLGQGRCVDEIGPGMPVTKDDCDPLAGRYVGGALCDDPGELCPVCDIADATLCSILDGYPEVPDRGMYVSDTSVPGYENMHRADDFVAADTTISQVCAWGSWMDRNDNQARRDCACVGDTQENDCTPRVQDNFTVSVWTNDNATPGVLVGTSTVSMARSIVSQEDIFDVWSISLILHTPITGLEVGETYWLDVTNNTVNDPGCAWYWASDGGSIDYGQITNSNHWSYATLYDAAWGNDEYATYDLTWRIDGGTPPPAHSAPQSACCSCDPLGDCEEITAWECGKMMGDWNPDGTCVPNTCPSTRPPGDVCAEGMLTAVEGVNPFSNLCATTDGPSPVTCECEPGASQKGWRLCRTVEGPGGPEGVPGAVDALADEGGHGHGAGFAPLSPAALEADAHQLLAGRLHHS